MIGILSARKFTPANVDLPKEHLPRLEGGNARAPVSIVEDPVTLLVTASSANVSIQYRHPLKCKMETISAPNPMLSPEEIFVGVIKQHAIMMSRSTTDFLLFTHIYCLGRWKS